MSNAPSKPVSFSRPKVGYFSNRPRTQEHQIQVSTSLHLFSPLYFTTIPNMPLLLLKDFLHTFLSKPHKQYLNPLRSHTDHPQERPTREGHDMQFRQTPTKIIQASSPGRPLMVLFLIIRGSTFKFYYMVHPHTQYRDTVLKQEF